MDLLGDPPTQRLLLRAHLLAHGHKVTWPGKARVMRVDCGQCGAWGYWEAAKGLAWGPVVFGVQCGEGRWAEMQGREKPEPKTDAVLRDAATPGHGDAERGD